MGHYDVSTKTNGTLKLKVNVVSDGNFTVKESSVESHVDVPLSKMVLGGNLKVAHARGEVDILLSRCNQPGDYKIIDNVV